MSLIVTGCQRSGTKSMAKILDIGHEQQFIPTTTQEIVCNLISGSARDNRLQSESSWLAQPFIALLKTNYRILHLVRHPLNVLASLLGIGFWTKDFEGTQLTAHRRYRRFIEQYLPGIINIHDPLTKSLYYWLYWNEPLDVFPRIRIETVQNSPTLNSRQRIKIAWKDISASTLKERVEAKAVMYGYAFE